MSRYAYLNEKAENQLLAEERNRQILRSAYMNWLEREENRSYKIRHEALEKANFILHTASYEIVSEDFVPSAETFSKCVGYTYQGTLPVRNEFYGKDLMTVDAAMLPSGVSFSYTSGFTNRFHALLKDDSRNINRNEWKDGSFFVNRIRKHVKKHKCFLNADITVTERDEEIRFSYLTENPDEFGQGIRTLFTKLAMLIDLQSGRTLPFCGIRDYEIYYTAQDTYDRFINLVCPPPLSTPNYHVSVDDYTFFSQLLGASYSQTKLDVILRMEELASRYASDAQKQTIPEERKLYEDAEALMTEHLELLKNMTDEKFDDLKDSVFDL